MTEQRVIGKLWGEVGTTYSSATPYQTRWMLRTNLLIQSMLCSPSLHRPLQGSFTGFSTHSLLTRPCSLSPRHTYLLYMHQFNREFKRTSPVQGNLPIGFLQEHPLPPSVSMTRGTPVCPKSPVTLGMSIFHWPNPVCWFKR